MPTKYTTFVCEGKLLQLKFSKKFPNSRVFKEPKRIRFKFKSSVITEGWAYHESSREFTTVEEIIQYFLDNQSSQFLKVKILGLV